MATSMREVDVGIGVLVNGEEALNPENGSVSVFVLDHQNLLPGTLVGSVYIDNKHLGIFSDTKVGGCDINDPTITVLKAQVNCRTGKVTVYWRRKVKRSQAKLIVSYEYKP